MLVLFAVLGTFPLWGTSVGLYNYLGVEIVVWIIYALGFNMLLGYTGLPSFGHGAYFGVGAYAYSLSYLNVFESVWAGILFGSIAGGVAAGLVACFLSHRRGIYFALMTIAFGQVFWFVSIKWHTLTGGEDGLLNVYRGTVSVVGADISLKSNETLFYFAFAILVAVTLLLWRIVHSPYGKALQAIRMSEMRAGFVGYNVWLMKWSVFTLSGIVAGLAGSIFAIAQESAYPDVMSLHASGFIVMMTLIGGGFVSFWGPVIGAIVFFVARDFLGALTETWLLWYGLMFMAVMLFKPEGIAGIWQDFIKKRQSKSAEAAVPNAAEEPVAGD
ncbi:MAG: branched-chain amino acid ABC transporter permease [Rhodospirillaceae bacterium]|nr:branched-chain amino acid ABC transporter permease [Rhodospirillaceae bacterium]